jgi:hypothetical protein
MYIRLLKIINMKNKKVIVITVTSLIVLSILYFAVKKASVKDVTNDPKLKADLDEIINKIDNAKK